jgi:hypothetical protein
MDPGGVRRARAQIPRYARNDSLYSIFVIETRAITW